MFSANAIAQARAVEITPFVSYQAGSSASSFDGSLAILADISYGVAVDVRVTPDTNLQVLNVGMGVS